jgi:ribose transport system permease protein
MPLGNQSKSIRKERSIVQVINPQQWGVLLVLIGLVIIIGISSPVFLSARNIRNVLQQVSTLGVVSMGMTVLMISGGIDLSVGSAMSVVAVIVGKMLKDWGFSADISILVGLALGSGIGYMNGVLVSRTRVHPFILTLGTMTALQGVAIVITEGYPITDLGTRFEVLGGGTIKGIPLIIILFFIVMFLCYFLLQHTQLGRRAYAIGGNEKTAFLAGIKVKRYKVIFYAFCGLLTGLAALLLASRISSAIPTMGSGFELQSIGAVVIGGTPLSGGQGSVWGTLVGVLLLGVIANGLNLLHVEASWQYIVTGVIIVVAVIIHEHRSK